LARTHINHDDLSKEISTFNLLDLTLTIAYLGITLNMPQQQTKPFTIRLFPFSPDNLKNIDAWLLSVFDLKIESYSHIKSTTHDTAEKHLYELAWRGQQLTNVFLRFANIPAFYSKKAFQLHKDKSLTSNLNVTFPVADIANIPANAYEIAIRSAFEILQWMTANTEINSQHTQQLYKIVDQKCRLPLKRFFTGGNSTLPILKAAYDKNIPFIHLGSGVYQLGWGRHSRQMSRSTTDSDSAIGSRTAQDKVKTALLLKMAGLPSPSHISVRSLNSAYDAAKKLGWPLVLKPTNCDRGEGVTIGITNNERLSTAFGVARQFSKRGPVIIEREVAGTCHRLFISNGRFLYATKRHPISVTGDGHHTVSQLIADSNSKEKANPPWLRSYQYPSDILAVEAMSPQGFTMSSIPKTNESVPLRPFQSDAWNAPPEDVTAAVHPDNITIAVRAANLFGLYNAGIDIISPDISQPWHKNNAIINEVNFAPLLGGTTISKSYLPNFLEQFIDGDGRIPVDVFVGGEAALNVAKQRQKDYLSQGVNSCLTSHKLTLYLSENEMVMPSNYLAQRCLALLTDKKVGALIVVVHTNECLFKSLPFDRINSLTKTHGELNSWENSEHQLATDASDTVIHHLEQMIAP